MVVLPTLVAVDVGQYISPWKPLVLFGLILIWVRLMTWADKDADDAHLPRLALNCAFAVGLVGALVLSALMPGFLAGFGVLLGVFVVELGTYLFLRNQKVGLKDLNKSFKQWVHSTFARKAKAMQTEAGQVGLISKSGVVPPPD